MTILTILSINTSITFFFKNDRLNEISRQFRRMKTIFNFFNQRIQFQKLHRQQSKFQHWQSKFQQQYSNHRRQSKFQQQSKLSKFQQQYSNQRQQSHYQFKFFQSRILRVTNVMMFDSIKHSINFFIRCFQQIAKIKDTQSMLRVLSMCLKKNALKWHNDFSSTIQMKMNVDLTMWKNELLKKYRNNRFDSIRKIHQMIFRFDKDIIFNQYFSRKINLLRDASVIDETMLIHYLWKKLNAQLIFVILIREDYDIVKSFSRKIKINEMIVKK